MSAFSLDPWRRMNTKLHRENSNTLGWHVILLTPHYRCPTPQIRRLPHPPLSGRTDGCPAQSAAHTAEPTGNSEAPGVFDGCDRGVRRGTGDSMGDCCLRWWADDFSLFVLTERGSKLCVMSFFSSPPPPPEILVRESHGFDWPELPATAGLMVSSTASAAASVCRCNHPLNKFVLLS